MSTFSQLIDMASDQRDYTLSDVLMKAKVLASELKSRKFRQWIDAEINGYDRKGEVPDYRIIPTKIVGEFAGDFHTFTRSPMSVTHLEQKQHDWFAIHQEHNGVSYIEDLIKDNEGEIGFYMDGYAVNFLRKHGMQISDMILNRVFKKISRHSCQQLLQSVRSRLLDFLLEIRGNHPELDTDGSAAINPHEVDAAFDRNVYHNCNFFKGVEMRDSYQAGQAGALGPNAKAENMNFIQVLREAIGVHSLGELAADLETLRTAMLLESKTSDQDEAVAAVAQAEDAAKKGNAKGAFEFLKKAGKWSFDVATKIGTAIAGKAIEKSMGL